MKILIIQQKKIGDVLTSSILFEVLRKKYPAAELHYLIYTHTLPVVENNPYIDRIWLYTEDTKEASNFHPLLKKIRKEKYDVVIDVYSKLGSAFLTALSGANMRISYKKWYTSQLYTHAKKRKSKALTPAGLAVENRLNLLQPLIDQVHFDVRPRIFLTETEVEAAYKILNDAGISPEKPLFMISVVGSLEKKTYPFNYLAVLLDHIVEQTEAQLLFNYIPAQFDEAKKVFDLCKASTQRHIRLDIFGRNLREFMALTSRCDALIGNEGGAVNMAKALDIPTFAIFSPAIEKEEWAVFENDQNKSVHLKDYRPELFDASEKPCTSLYSVFSPDLILAELQKFLKSITPISVSSYLKK